MLTQIVYPWISLVVWTAAALVVLALITRVVFSYADPNPFGAAGRFAFRIRKLTDPVVYPAARFFAAVRLDVRFAPLLTAAIVLIASLFVLQFFGGVFFVTDGLSGAAAAGDASAAIGYVLYGLLSVLVLLILIRFFSFWFVYSRNTFLDLVRRVTDPILRPFSRLIPPIGMFDISAMILLLLISLLQSLVLRMFVR